MSSASHNILIGTPAYGGMVHLDYLVSISEYYQARINFTIAAIGNESLITRARNAILSQFYDETAFTHLLFLDGDVYLPASGLQRLLTHDVDAVAAAVPLKGFNERGERIFNVGQCLGESGSLHEVERVGTAALMLSRKAVNDLVAEAKQAGDCYQRLLMRGSDSAQVHYDVFKVGVVGGDYLSEDFWVCHRLRSMGYRIFVDPEITTRHQGVTQF
jgi:hypothetical protein